MRLALIPPYSMVGLVSKTDYQLLLPQCLTNNAYVAAYRKARAFGSFMILDNGVAEGVDYTAAQLHTAATQMMVNEIVIHDVMQDAAATWTKTQAFVSSFQPQFNYMGVLQGSSWDELRWLAERYNSVPRITTIGIPRHLITTLGDNQARVRVAARLTELYGNRFKIHLLGTSPDYIKEVGDNLKYFERLGVRGVDTSAPFNYTYANASMGTALSVARPSGYFDLPDTSFDPGFLDLNLQYMRRWSIND